MTRLAFLNYEKENERPVMTDNEALNVLNGMLNVEQHKNGLSRQALALCKAVAALEVIMETCGRE